MFALKQLTTSEGPQCATSQKIQIYSNIDMRVSDLYKIFYTLVVKRNVQISPSIRQIPLFFTGYN